MDEEIYKPSVRLYIMELVIGLLLCIVIIGIPIIIGITIRQFRTSLTLKKNGLEFKKGLINVQHKEIGYDKINSVETTISIVGKYLGFGTIQVYTGNDRDKLMFTGVNHVTELRQKLETKRRVLKLNIASSGVSSTHAQRHTTVSVADELTKLASLKKQGILTQEEFDKKKAQLLG